MRVVLGVTAVILLSVCGSVAGSNSTSLAPIPTSSPTSFPTPSPTSFPTPSPTSFPTPSPTSFPTPSPSPSPTPSVPVYIGRDAKGNQLFRLQGSINVSVTFNATMVLPFQVPYNVSEVHIVVVKANEGSMTANLSWSDPGPCSDDCNFTLVFKLSADQTRGSKSWQVDEVDFIFHVTPDLHLTHNEELYKTQLGRAYQCSTVKVGLASANHTQSNATALVHIQTFELQAFSFSKNDTFDASPLVCGQDMPDNKIVPIAVGAALALLVIIVVIAYIIGRFRNRGKKSDYEVISS